MIHHSRADIEQVDLNVLKICPSRFQKNVQDGERFVGLLRDFFSKFGIAEIRTRPDDEDPFRLLGEKFSRCLGGRPIEECIDRCTHVSVGGRPQASIDKAVAVVMIAF